MKCPKCGGEMKSGSAPSNFRILKEGDLYGDGVWVYYCGDCGFIELYKEPSTKESRRRRYEESELAPAREETPQPEKEESERKPVKRLVR